MRSTWLVLGFAILYFIVEANATNRAFVFNYKKNSIINLPNNLSNINCDDWATACPAKDEDEQNFEEKHSVYNRALYLQNIYNEKSVCRDLNKAVCDEPFEPSVAIYDPTYKFEIGFELFHETEKIAKISRHSFSEYYPMKRMAALSSPYAFLTFPRASSFQMREREKNESQLTLRGAKMEFLWIPLVRIHMNVVHIRYVEYEIRKNNINPMLPCQDYTLGQELAHGNVIDLLFSKRVQQKIFENVKLPTRTDDEVPEGACDPEYECLTKWPLLPTDQFQFNYDLPLKCSHLTTIPIWKSTVEKIMTKLDKYLYTLQRISGQPLRILAGVDQVLKLPKTTSRFDKPVDLEEEKSKILTPKTIYKMVKFKLNHCEKGKSCWYGVLIVIHNGPYLTEKDHLCKDLSEDLGWEEIKYATWSNKGVRSKFIYVCELSNETMKSVGLTYVKDTEFVPLSLFKFPIFNENQQLVFKSIKGDVYDELLRLSDPDEKVELDDGVIERPSLDDNFGSADESGDDFVFEEEEIETEGKDADLKK